MGVSFHIVPVLLTLLLYLVNCEHEYHHQNDDKWLNILSQIESFWKNKTEVPSTTTEHTETHGNKGYHWNSHDGKSTTELPSTAVVQNGTIKENVQEAFKASLALLIGAPIAGIVVLCCCCYCFCKCCAACCCEDKDEGKVIVVQQNNTQPAPPPAQHTQVIVQQPVYQTPAYGMQPMAPQWGPAPQQQWAAPQQQQPYQYQQQHQHPAAYDNPDYGEPSAPPPQYGQKY